MGDITQPIHGPCVPRQKEVEENERDPSEGEEAQQQPKRSAGSGGGGEPDRGQTVHVHGSIKSSGTNALASRNKSSQRHPRTLLLEKSSVLQQLWCSATGQKGQQRSGGRTRRGAHNLAFGPG